MKIGSMMYFVIWHRFFRRLKPYSVALLLTLAASAALTSVASADVGAWIVIDAETGAVLDEQDATRMWYPASVTKLMTAYVAFRAIREGKATPESIVTYSANAAAEPPSKMGFKVGTQLTLDNALKMLLIKSANDIAVAVAETIGGSEEEFIRMMNAEADRMGLMATHFVNPHGLPDNRQISSARDLAVISMFLWRDFPEFRDYFSHAGARFGKKLLKSANREYLARVDGANGLKTGFICNSGYNVAVSATRGGRTVIAVIMGAGSGLERLALSRQLIDKGFRAKNGRSITTLTAVGDPPPADGYCKSNPKLSPEELAARYGGAEGKNSRSAGLLAYGGNKDPQASRILPGVDLSAADGGDDDIEVPRKGKKINWAKFMDDLVGKRQPARELIRVSTGIPAGAVPAKTAPAAELAPVETAPTVSTVPVAKPAAAKSGPAAAPGAIANPAVSAAEHGKTSPGAIFSGSVTSKTPFPIVKPTK